MYLQSRCLVSSDSFRGYPFNAKMAETEELLLIRKQMQPVLLLGGGSSCNLLAAVSDVHRG